MKYIAFILLVLTCNTVTAEERFLGYNDVEQDILADFQNLSTQTVNGMNELGFKDFDYEEESVKVLSDFITKQGPTLSIDAKNKLISNWGAYLGTAIIKRYGGKWVSLNGGYCVLIGDSYITLPFDKAYKHVRFGETEAIYAMFLSENKIKHWSS